jgi:hypothetical protein
MMTLIPMGETPEIIKLSQRNFTLNTLGFMQTALAVIGIVSEPGTLPIPDALIGKIKQQRPAPFSDVDSCGLCQWFVPPPSVELAEPAKFEAEQPTKKTD